MTGRLEGKRAFVTAAGAGIGRAIAFACAREGASVQAADINAVALDGMAWRGISTFLLDVTDPDAIQAAAEASDGVDILVNAAGWVANGSILECSEEDWSRSLNLNVTSMFRIVRAFLPTMLERGGGSIVNVSSVASSIKGIPNRFAYGTSKAAVIGLTKAVAADFVTRGVRCNAICPGTIDTPSLTDRMRAIGELETTRAAFVARQPMGRLGTAEEIAHLAVYLASDEAAFTTGAVHVIDGGWIN